MPGKTKYDEYALYTKLAKSLTRVPNAMPADHKPILDRLGKIVKEFEAVKFCRKKSNLRLAEISV